MRNLEARWNKQKIVDDTFAARPTKVKMPEDYARNIRSAVTQGLLDPDNDVQDAQLLFAFACGTMLGFRGNKVCGGLSIFLLCVVSLKIIDPLTLPLGGSMLRRNITGFDLPTF